MPKRTTITVKARPAVALLVASAVALAIFAGTASHVRASDLGPDLCATATDRLHTRNQTFADACRGYLRDGGFNPQTGKWAGSDILMASIGDTCEHGGYKSFGRAYQSSIGDRFTMCAGGLRAFAGAGIGIGSLAAAIGLGVGVTDLVAHINKHDRTAGLVRKWNQLKDGISAKANDANEKSFTKEERSTLRWAASVDKDGKHIDTPPAGVSRLQRLFHGDDAQRDRDTNSQALPTVTTEARPLFEKYLVKEAQRRYQLVKVGNPPAPPLAEAPKVVMYTGQRVEAAQRWIQSKWRQAGLATHEAPGVATHVVELVLGI